LAEKVYCICASTVDAVLLVESVLAETLTRNALALSLTITDDVPCVAALPDVPSLPPQPNNTAVARLSAVSLNDLLIFVFMLEPFS
jgi:hypothetical protein